MLSVQDATEMSRILKSDIYFQLSFFVYYHLKLLHALKLKNQQHQKSGVYTCLSAA
jgi:hypothetical protein